MMEQDYFRIAREQIGDFDLTICRRAALTAKPYFVSLIARGQMYSAQGQTLTEALDSAFSKYGIKIPRRDRVEEGPLLSGQNPEGYGR